MTYITINPYNKKPTKRKIRLVPRIKPAIAVEIPIATAVQICEEFKAEDSEAEDSEAKDSEAEDSEETENKINIDLDKIDFNFYLYEITIIKNVLYNDNCKDTISSWHPAIQKICIESYKESEYMPEVCYAYKILENRTYSAVGRYLEDLRQDIQSIDPYNYKDSIGEIIRKILVFIGPIYPHFRTISNRYPIIEKPLGGSELDIREKVSTVSLYLYIF